MAVQLVSCRLCSLSAVCSIATTRRRSMHCAAPSRAPFSLRRFIGHTDAIYVVAFSPDGKQALTAGADTTTRLWDLSTGQQLHIFGGHTDAIRAVSFSADGKEVLTGGEYGTARLWDIASGQVDCTPLTGPG